MKKTDRQIRKLLIIVFSSALLLPLNVYAGLEQDFLAKVDNVYLGVKAYGIAIIPVAAIVIAIMYMATPFNYKNKNNAKIALYGLIVGTLFLFLSTDIAQWIAQLLGKDWNNLQFDIFPDKIVSVHGTNVDAAGNPDAPSSDVIEYAKTFLGIKYTWGGEDPSTGFDCSGLMQYVWKHFGVNLPRVASAQSQSGTYVNKENLQPGDLLFFDTEGKGTVTHVGMYIGGGQFIHAPQTGDVVKIVDLNTSYWNPKYLTARRVN